MSLMTTERHAPGVVSLVGYDPAVSRVRIVGAKEARVSFSDMLNQVQAGDRLLVLRNNAVALVLVSLDFYDGARDALGEPPPADRELRSVDAVRGAEWTATLAAVAAGKHITLLRNGRPIAMALPPRFYSNYLKVIGEPELALD